jgi:hypothetical protein
LARGLGVGPGDRDLVARQYLRANADVRIECASRGQPFA